MVVSLSEKVQKDGRSSKPINDRREGISHPLLEAILISCKAVSSENTKRPVGGQESCEIDLLGSLKTHLGKPEAEGGIETG